MYKGPHFYKNEIETIIGNALIELVENKYSYLFNVDKLLVKLEKSEIKSTQLRIKLDS